MTQDNLDQPKTADTDVPVSVIHTDESQQKGRCRRKAVLIAVVIVLAALMTGVHYFRFAVNHESTNDAFIDGHIIPISPRVAGHVAEVLITDNQKVAAGDLLATLDTRDFQAKLDAADGYVTKKGIEPGAYVQVGQSIMAIVTPDVWVTANFKETQLTCICPGQAVQVSVDAFPELVLHGRIDSIQRGTGSRFSLLPPENATGNFVKVVQRVPVKILIDNADEISDAAQPPVSSRSLFIELSRAWAAVH